MSEISGSRVLITGGASGIGKIMGRMALERGAEALVIWDINEANIAAAKAELGTKGRVFARRVDVSNADEVAQAYSQAKSDIGGIDILINCAGIVAGNKTFDRESVADIRRTMEINAIAPMTVALQMLPDMMVRDSGHICNIASAGGLISNPRMSVYGASKWAVVGWSDSVRIELSEARSRVRITTVAPYYISTGMFDGVRSRLIPILDPERTSRKILRAIERNRDFRGIPFGFHFIRLMQGIFPTAVFDFLFGKCFGIYSTMDNFVGRKQA